MLPQSASRAGMAASQGSLEPSRDSASSAVRRSSGSELVVEFASCRPGPSDPKFDGDLHPSHPSKKGTRVLETATLVFLGGEGESLVPLGLISCFGGPEAERVT